MISIIVAVAENRVIGCQGRLVFRISEDLQRFKRLTTGHPVVMGRKTWESIGRPLPGRTNIVVTRQAGFTAEGAVTTGSLERALELARQQPGGSDEIFVIGGGEIYTAAMEWADRLYVTEIDARPEGDTLFPVIDPGVWRPLWIEQHEGYRFVDYARAGCL